MLLNFEQSHALQDGLLLAVLLLFPHTCINAVSCPLVSRGPYLQIPSQTGITIRWQTTTNTLSAIIYSSIDSGNFTEPAEHDATQRGREHEARITGLSPGRVYVYLLQSVREHSYGVEACGGNFTTSPLPGNGSSLRFWAIGDSGLSNEDQAAVKHSHADLLQSGYKLTDAVLVLGDLAYDGGYEAEMDISFFGSYQDLMSWIPFWTALGNHDVYNGLDPYPYYQLLTLPTEGEAGGHPSGTEAYYSFDLGQVHVVCLDSMDSVHRGTMAEMLAWLDEDLLAFRAQGAATHWLIAFFHHPPYSKVRPLRSRRAASAAEEQADCGRGRPVCKKQRLHTQTRRGDESWAAWWQGSHDSDVKVEMIRMREEVVPRLELAGVDLVISGHSHGYERSFLLKSFYGDSSTWSPVRHQMDSGSGNPSQGEMYVKEGAQDDGKQGTVYIVCGVSSEPRHYGTFDHPAMVASVQGEAGSLLIDVEGYILSVKFVNASGDTRDHFAICKGGFATCSMYLASPVSPSPPIPPPPPPLSSPPSSPAPSPPPSPPARSSLSFPSLPSIPKPPKVPLAPLPPPSSLPLITPAHSPPPPESESFDTRATWLSKENGLWQISIIVGSVVTIIMASLIIFKRAFRFWRREDMVHTLDTIKDSNIFADLSVSKRQSYPITPGHSSITEEDFCFNPSKVEAPTCSARQRFAEEDLCFSPGKVETPVCSARLRFE